MAKLTDGREVITAPNESAVLALLALGWERVDAPPEKPKAQRGKTSTK